MAERAFFLVPADPFYLPDEARCAEFLRFFQGVSPLPNGYGSYYCYRHDIPQLIDAGEAFEKIICPGCGAQLRLYTDEGWTKHYQWWLSALAQPRDEAVPMPCCGRATRVVDLRFQADGAFARFAVGALEPSDSDYWEDEDRPYGFLKAATLRQFEEILGCGLLQIWQIQ
jgi:hypothetical protein